MVTPLGIARGASVRSFSVPASISPDSTVNRADTALSSHSVRATTASPSMAGRSSAARPKLPHRFTPMAVRASIVMESRRGKAVRKKASLPILKPRADSYLYIKGIQSAVTEKKGLRCLARARSSYRARTTVHPTWTHCFRGPDLLLAAAARRNSAQTKAAAAHYSCGTQRRPRRPRRTGPWPARSASRGRAWWTGTCRSCCPACRPRRPSYARHRTRRGPPGRADPAFRAASRPRPCPAPQLPAFCACAAQKDALYLRTAKTHAAMPA